VAHVVHIREEVVATPETAEGAVAAVPGAAPAAGEGGAATEPEVIKKGKGDAEAAGGKKPEAKSKALPEASETGSSNSPS